MTTFSLLALAGAMLLLAITPGPGVFATVARSLASGFKHSSVVVLGIVAGDLIFLLMAIYGLAAIAEHLNGLFLIIKYLGSAYLIYLGVKLWKEKPVNTEVDGIEEYSWSANFLSGLFITLGNPKVIFFYLGFLPTFVELEALSGKDIAMIATVVTVILGATMLVYAYTASKARKLFQSSRSQTWMNRTAGGTMIATGTALAAKT